MSLKVSTTSESPGAGLTATEAVPNASNQSWSVAVKHAPGLSLVVLRTQKSKCPRGCDFSQPFGTQQCTWWVLNQLSLNMRARSHSGDPVHYRRPLGSTRELASIQQTRPGDTTYISNTATYQHTLIVYYLKQTEWYKNVSHLKIILSHKNCLNWKLDKLQFHTNCNNQFDSCVPRVNQSKRILK